MADKLKVLVVDDAFITRNVIKKIFDDLGHNVVAEAKNGKEAVELYKSLKPDLVTMDINMPDMNGVEALKKIIEFDKDAIVIMITSIGQEKMVLEAMEYGASAYIQKVITQHKIEEVLEDLFLR